MLSVFRVSSVLACSQGHNYTYQHTDPSSEIAAPAIGIGPPSPSPLSPLFECAGTHTHTHRFSATCLFLCLSTLLTSANNKIPRESPVEVSIH